jgi:hypothetical protein
MTYINIRRAPVRALTVFIDGYFYRRSTTNSLTLTVRKGKPQEFIMMVNV